MTSISYKLEPVTWLCDTGQQIPCFDRCQLIITWMSNLKVHSKPRLHVSQPTIWSMATILRDSATIIIVVSTRPRAVPLAMITMRKSTHGFPFLSHMSMGLHLAVRKELQFKLYGYMPMQRVWSSAEFGIGSRVLLIIEIETRKWL